MSGPNAVVLAQSAIKLFRRPPLLSLRSQTDSGMTPENIFSCRLKVVMRVRLPTSSGTVPVNWLPATFERIRRETMSVTRVQKHLRSPNCKRKGIIRTYFGAAKIPIYQKYQSYQCRLPRNCRWDPAFLDRSAGIERWEDCQSTHWNQDLKRRVLSINQSPMESSMRALWKKKIEIGKMKC